MKEQMIFHRPIERNYLIVDRELFRNKKLSLKAKGLMGYLLSLPKTWNLNPTDIANKNKDGIDSVVSGINELISTGYIHKESLRNSKGHQCVKYLVYAFPEDNPYLDFPNRETPTGKSQQENPDRETLTGKACQGNPSIDNKERKDNKENQDIIENQDNKSSSTSNQSYITDRLQQLKQFGLNENEIDDFWNDIDVDDDEIRNLISEKIKMLEDKILQDKIKSNPKNYTIQTLNNLKTTKILILQNVKAQKRASGKRKKSENIKTQKNLDRLNELYDSLPEKQKSEISQQAITLAKENNEKFKLDMKAFKWTLETMPESLYKIFTKYRNEILKKKIA